MNTQVTRPGHMLPHWELAAYDALEARSDDLEAQASRSMKRLAIGLMIASALSAVVWELILAASFQAVSELHTIPAQAVGHVL
jgi:hypothetical protein